MRVRVLEGIPEDPETILAWNRLVFRMERPEVFFTQQWALAASRAFSEGLILFTFLVDDAGRLTGVVVLAARRESPDRAFFLTASTADYCDILSDPEDREAVLTAVLAELGRLGIKDLVLANVPAESRTLPVAQSATKAHGFHHHRRLSYDCGLISMEDEQTRQAVLQSLRKKEQERRALRKLGQLGPLQVTHLNAEQMETGVRRIISAQISRFLASNRISPLINGPRRVFLTELASLLTSEGWMKVSQLEVNGKPIAWNYGFRFLESWFWYLPTFEVESEKLSPGSCLLWLLVEEACADSEVKRLDLGLGDERYKARFSNASTTTYYLHFSQSLSRHGTSVARAWLAAFIKRRPDADKNLRRGREVVRRLGERIRKDGITSAAKGLLARAASSVVSKSEVAFFEAGETAIIDEPKPVLRLMEWEDLATAAIDNCDDGETLDYLMRCGQRLRAGRAVGYVLEESRSRSVAHFLWVDSYDGFYLSEINCKLDSEDSSAAMIFDCWTPVAQRGHGSYTTAIRLAASLLRTQQKQPWIFCASSNTPSARGIVKAGFVYRFSMLRKKNPFQNVVSRRDNVAAPDT